MEEMNYSTFKQQTANEMFRRSLLPGIRKPVPLEPDHSAMEWASIRDQEASWWTKWLEERTRKEAACLTRIQKIEAENAKWKERRAECAKRQVEYEKRLLAGVCSGSVRFWTKQLREITGPCSGAGMSVITSDDRNTGGPGLRVCRGPMWDNVVRILEDG